MDWTYLTCGSLASEGGGLVLAHWTTQGVWRGALCDWRETARELPTERGRQGGAPEGLRSKSRRRWSSEGQGSEGGERQETQGWATWSSVGQCTIFLLSSLATDSFICSFICFRICSFIYSFIPACYKGQVPVFSELAVC